MDVYGESCCDARAAASRLDLQLSSQLSHSLSHALNAHACTNWHRHPLAPITDLDRYRVGVAGYYDARGATARVPVDIREALLYDAEHCGLKFSRQAPKSGLQLQIHLDFASLGKPFDKPAHGRLQPGLVEQWWVKEVRHGPQVSRQLFYETQALRNLPDEFGFSVLERLLHWNQVQVQSNQY